MKNKKGFISMTVIYSFLLLLIFLLLTLLFLYSQKSKYVDSIIDNAKTQIKQRKKGDTKIAYKLTSENCFTVGSSSVTGYETAITSYSCGDKEIVIPSKIDGKSINTINPNAFQNKGLEVVILNEGIEYIGSSAFANNNIKLVQLPSTLVEISAHAFEDNLLTTVTIPSKTKAIGSYAFSDNYLKSVVMENKTSISSLSITLNGTNYDAELKERFGMADNAPCIKYNQSYHEHGCFVWKN